MHFSCNIRDVIRLISPLYPWFVLPFTWSLPPHHAYFFVIYFKSMITKFVWWWLLSWLLLVLLLCCTLREQIYILKHEIFRLNVAEMRINSRLSWKRAMQMWEAKKNAIKKEENELRAVAVAIQLDENEKRNKKCDKSQAHFASLFLCFSIYKFSLFVSQLLFFFFCFVSKTRSVCCAHELYISQFSTVWFRMVWIRLMVMIFHVRNGWNKKKKKHVDEFNFAVSKMQISAFFALWRFLYERTTRINSGCISILSVSLFVHLCSCECGLFSGWLYRKIFSFLFIFAFTHSIRKNLRNII